MAQLTILGAAYGLGCRTEKMRDIQGNSNQVVVTANNATFGDTWHGNKKSLVVVYQYTGYNPMVAIAPEGQQLTISPPGFAVQQAQKAPSDAFRTLGAAYGLGDVTTKTNSLISSNTLEITANNSIFPDSWKGEKKSFVAVFQNEGCRPYMVVIKEDTYISVSSQ